MGYAKCTVTISNKTPQFDPYDVCVTRGKEDGIKWKLKTPGYKFTGVTIGGSRTDRRIWGSQNLPPA